jgi:hypothetical protein
MKSINELQIPLVIYHNDNEKLMKEVMLSTGKKLNQLLLKDFVLKEPIDCNLSHGVYVFKEKTEIRYVGKASSRPFIERVPAHLDTRGYGWMNTMLKYLSKEDKREKGYLEESIYAIDNFELLLVLFKTEDCIKENITKVESYLIENTNCLNKKKRKKRID